jgi:elongation factor Ts
MAVVTIADITKLRKLTGAGMMDCKKALEASDNDIEKATEILRQKGQAVAAKRSDRDASNGCVLVKSTGTFAALVALNCETDFVATNADFVKLTQQIIDVAVANKCKNVEEVKSLKLNDKDTVQDAIVARSGITGEKMELGAYLTVEGESVAIYNHQGKNILGTLVAFNKVADETVAHQIAMQIAAMNPIAIDEASVPEEVKEREFKVAVEKTKEEQVEKAVQNALKKAGYNLYIAENEEHLEEGIEKKEITQEQADDIRRIKKEVAEQKAANLPEQMVQNIAKGRMAKFYKEVCLVEQEDIMDPSQNIAQLMAKSDKDLKITAFQRYTFRAE